MMSHKQVLQSVIAVSVVLSFLVGCGNTSSTPVAEAPEAISPSPEQATASSTPEPPTATSTPEPPTATPTPVPPTATSTPPTIDIQALSSELDTMLQKTTEEGLFIGSVLVAQNGQVILSKGYGFADHKKKVPNTAQTKFRIASLTKQFTAMAIIILQEQGKLHVQDKICTYLTDCPDVWNPITIHHLLTHTSGIPNNFDAFYMRDLTSALPLEQMIADVKTKPLSFQPGEEFSYNDTGYVLLGKIIEAVSSQSYEIFLQKNIFDPLQMSSTGFDHNLDDLAVGYWDNYSLASPFNLWVASSAAGLYTTVEDLYRWDQALYTDKFVPQKVLDMMFTAHVLTGSDDWGYGYGWRIGPDNQQSFLVHGGIITGFSSIIKRYPDDKATIIILANQENTDLYSTADLVESKLFGK